MSNDAHKKDAKNNEVKLGEKKLAHHQCFGNIEHSLIEAYISTLNCKMETNITHLYKLYI
jgi:hypothetical protein